MQKELIICTIIIVGILVLNIITQNYTKDSIQIISTNLEKLQEKIINIVDNKQEEEPHEELKQEVEYVIEEWKSRYEKLAYYIEHDELEKVQTELTAIQANIEVQEYAQSMPNLRNCIFILEHIRDKFSLRLKNVF